MTHQLTIAEQQDANGALFEQLIKEIRQGRIDQTCLKKVYQLLEDEFRIIRYHPDHQTFNHAKSFDQALIDADYADLWMDLYLIQDAILHNSLGYAAYLADRLRKEAFALSTEEYNALEPQLAEVESKLQYWMAFNASNHKSVLKLGKGFTNDDFERDPTLYFPLICAQLISAQEATSERSRKIQITKALGYFDEYKKIADPGFHRRVAISDYLQILEANEQAYLLLLENLSSVPTEGLRMEASLKLWDFYTDWDVTEEAPKIYSKKWSPFKRLLWLNSLVEESDLESEIYSKAFFILLSGFNVLESNVLNSFLYETEQNELLLKAVETHEKLFPADPFIELWRARALYELGDIDQATETILAGIQRYIDHGVDPNSVEIQIREAGYRLSDLCLEKKSIEPFNTFIKGLPQDWRVPILYYSKLQMLFQIYSQPLKPHERREVLETFDALPVEIDNPVYKLVKIRCYVFCRELLAARDSINALRQELEPNNDIGDEVILNELMSLENTINELENTTKHALKPAKPTRQKPSLDLGDCQIDLGASGAVIHNILKITDDVLGIVISTPQMPKGIAYLVTANLVDQCKARGEIPVEIHGALCEFGIPIPYHEAKKIREKDWRVQLMSDTVDSILTEGLMPIRGFFTYRDGNNTLPACDYQALMILETKQPIFDEACPIKVGEMVPLYIEELNYGKTHSDEDLIRKLETVAYYPTKRRRRNACEGEG